MSSETGTFYLWRVTCPVIAENWYCIQYIKRFRLIRRREVEMAQFNYKLSSNIRQDFPYHFMSLLSKTRKRRQSKLSASTSLTETSPNVPFTFTPF